MTVIAQRGWDQFLIADPAGFRVFDVDAGRLTDVLDPDLLADLAESGEWVPFDGPAELEQRIAETVKQDLSLAFFEAGAAEHHGLLVSLRLAPDAAQQLAMAGGEPADNLHITLCYCGDVADLGDVAIARAIVAVERIAATTRPFSSAITGMGRFAATPQSDGRDVIYAEVECPHLQEFRERLKRALIEAGCPPRSDFHYVPHITLAYVAPAGASDSNTGPEAGKWSVPRLTLDFQEVMISVGDMTSTIPFGRVDLGGNPYRGEGGRFTTQEGVLTVSNPAKRLDEIKTYRRDSRFSPIVQEQFDTAVRDVRAFLDNPSNVLAREKEGEYEVVVHPLGRLLTIKEGVSAPAPGGVWQDFWEDDHEQLFGVTNAAYAKMPRTDRAALEAKTQLNKYAEDQFADNYAGFWFPEEHDRWYWDEGGKAMNATESSAYWKKQLKLSVIADDRLELGAGRDPDTGRFGIGSGESKGVSAKFADAPDSKAGGKAWVKERQADYDTDNEFRAVADAVTLYTQGSYDTIRDATILVEDASYEPPSVGTDVRDRFFGDSATLDSHAHPIAEYKSKFRGQDVTASKVKVLEAARALNRAIDTAEPLKEPIYRGLTGSRPLTDLVEGLKPGDPFEVRGATSFTLDELTAHKFAREETKWHRRRGRSGSRLAPVVLEVRGARGLKVGALSPYQQREVISRGRYRVQSVTSPRIDGTYRVQLEAHEER